MVSVIDSTYLSNASIHTFSNSNPRNQKPRYVVEVWVENKADIAPTMSL